MWLLLFIKSNKKRFELNKQDQKSAPGFKVQRKMESPFIDSNGKMVRYQMSENFKFSLNPLPIIQFKV